MPGVTSGLWLPGYREQADRPLRKGQLWRRDGVGLVTQIFVALSTFWSLGEGTDQVRWSRESTCSQEGEKDGLARALSQSAPACKVHLKPTHLRKFPLKMLMTLHSLPQSLLSCPIGSSCWCQVEVSL